MKIKEHIFFSIWNHPFKKWRHPFEDEKEYGNQYSLGKVTNQ